MSTWPYRLPTGLGVGWRAPIARSQAKLTPAFVEVLADNHNPDHLDEHLQILVDSPVPVVTHGVSLSLGSAAVPNPQTLSHLNAVAQACGSPVISEHIALVRADALDNTARENTALDNYDEPHADVLEAGHLLPVPLTENQLAVMIDNVKRAQDVLVRPLALEPIATLVEWPEPQMSEGEFVHRLLDATDAGLVLDIANVWANAVNHGREPLADVLAMPLDRIAYCHIAGGSWRSDMYHDTHASPVVREVLALAHDVTTRTGPVPLMLERDANFPPEPELFAELDALADLSGARRITP